MNALLRLNDRLGLALDRLSLPILTTAARIVFAGTLLIYFWNSAMTKVGDGVLGIFQVTAGGFGQIFPKQAEAVLWDVSQMSGFQKLVVLAGTWAEFILPALIVIGLLTRLAALGMIGFVLVQSLTDVLGHSAGTGGWFDAASDAAIADQRAFWILLLLILVLRGAGPLSADRLIRNGPSPHPAAQLQ